MKQNKEKSIKQLKKELRTKVLNDLNDKEPLSDEEYNALLSRLERLYALKEEDKHVDINVIIQSASMIVSAALPIVAGVLKIKGLKK